MDIHIDHHNGSSDDNTKSIFAGLFSDLDTTPSNSPAAQLLDELSQPHNIDNKTYNHLPNEVNRNLNAGIESTPYIPDSFTASAEKQSSAVSTENATILTPSSTTLPSLSHTHAHSSTNSQINNIPNINNIPKTPHSALVSNVTHEHRKRGLNVSGSPNASFSEGDFRPLAPHIKKERHRKHSKRYRDNLGVLFAEVVDLLPQITPHCELQTKSKIISTCVAAMKSLRTEVSSLQMQYVTSSVENRNNWIRETVSTACVVQDVIEPCMRLLISLHGWRQSELWMHITNNVNCTDGGAFRLERVTSAGAGDNSRGFLKFVNESRRYSFRKGDASIVGRAAHTCKSESVDLTSDTAWLEFTRCDIARPCDIGLCFALPFLVGGKVVAVIVFYDNSSSNRNISANEERFRYAEELASAMGNAYANKKNTTLLAHDR